MSAKNILALCGDRGGYNAVKPVLSHAIDQECEVSLYLTATCARQFNEGRLPFDSRITIKVGSSTRGFPDTNGIDVAVLGASQSEEGAQGALYLERIARSIPIVVVEDMYGSAIPMLKKISALSVEDPIVCVM